MVRVFETLAASFQSALTEVLAVLRTAAHSTREPVAPQRARFTGIDEFWSFVGKKKRQRWTWLAFDRQRKQVAAYHNGRLDRPQLSTVVEETWHQSGQTLSH